MKTILVTGFGPFAEHKINSSWEAVKLLPDEINDFKVVKLEIPVIYNYIEHEVPALWREHNPELVIHVGVSSYTTELKLEKQAYRSGYKRADCIRKLRCCQSVSNSGEDCIFTDLDVDQICEQVNKMGVVKTSPSDNAGRYLCEFTYYTSLHIDRRKVLFVHVPPLEKPYSAADLSKGLYCIINSILDRQDENARLILAE